MQKQAFTLNQLDEFCLNFRKRRSPLEHSKKNKQLVKNSSSDQQTNLHLRFI